jgi:hypothetical protein
MNQNQITMMRGDTRSLTVTVLDDDGDPYDLTGVGVQFTVDALFDKSVGDGVAVATPASGVAVVTVNPVDTADAPDRRRAYRYDVQLTLADGSVRTPIHGLFVVRPDVATE